MKTNRISAFLRFRAALWLALGVAIPHGNASAQPTQAQEPTQETQPAGEPLVHFAELTYGISFSYPPTLHEIPRSDPRVIVQLGSRTETGFPTFNIVSLPGPYPFVNRSSELLAGELAGSYRAVGLTDARVIGTPSRTERAATSASTSEAPETLIEAELHYTSREHPYQANVWILSRPQSHLIFTFLNSTENWQDSRHALKIIHDSLFTKGGPVPVPQAPPNYPSLSMRALLLVVVASALLFLRKSYRSPKLRS